MAIRRVHGRGLSPAQAREEDRILALIEEEKPEISARCHAHLDMRKRLFTLFAGLLAAREELGMSLADLSKFTGMDRSAISRLETGKQSNPTIQTLIRYAEAVGKNIDFVLSD